MSEVFQFTRPTCANLSCKGRKGSRPFITCANCKLVLYCNAKCEKANQQYHNLGCLAEMCKAGWKAPWELQDRSPFFISDRETALTVETLYNPNVWGNRPAIDALALDRNEGANYSKPLNILFGACNDIRSVIMTLINIPESCTSPITVVTNHKDSDASARNALILLLILTTEDALEAAECAIHLWYSAFIPTPCVALLKKMRPMLLKAYKSMSSSTSDVLEHTFSYGTRSIKLSLNKETWKKALRICEGSCGFDKEAAYTYRQRAMLPHVDVLARMMLEKPPMLRHSCLEYLRHGILLPFEHRRDDFKLPNASLYTRDGKWKLAWGDSPLLGWPHQDVLGNMDVGLAENDIMGKLFYNIRRMIVKFHQRISAMPVTFIVSVHPPGFSERSLGSLLFDRIEFSDVTELDELKFTAIMVIAMKCLRPYPDNKHATIIGMFTKAVIDTYLSDCRGKAFTKEEYAHFRRIFPEVPDIESAALDMKPSSTFVKALFLLESFRDRKKHFARYMAEWRFSSIAPMFQMRMKKQNTIVEEWPFGVDMKDDPVNIRIKSSTNCLFGVAGSERYVEWRREAH